MIQVNPDPHAQGYMFTPLNRVTAAFTSIGDLRHAVDGLQAMGVASTHIDVFVGVDGAEALDVSGVAHGVVARNLRKFEALMEADDHETEMRTDATLRAGGAAIAVLMDGREDSKGDVAAVLKGSRGTLITYWKRWVTEKLG